MDRNTKRGFRPTLDRLDARRLMAARLTASLAHGVLTVKGTAAADVIAVNLQASRGGTIAVEGVRKVFRASQVKRIDVLGGAGNDTISVQTSGRPNLRVRINGGAGNDTINGVPESPPPRPATPPVVNPVVVIPRPVASSPAPAAPAAPVAPVAPTISTAVQRIVDLTNAERRKGGLAPMAVSAPLVRAAEIQSGNMARLDVMSHVLPGTDQPNLTDRASAVGYRYASLGENIAFNYANADAVVAGWMGSPGHRANILNASFTEIGVGVAFNGRGEPYYTQVFGRPA